MCLYPSVCPYPSAEPWKYGEPPYLATQEHFEETLKLTRLLVEFGKLERIDDRNLSFGLRFGSMVCKSYVPSALKYLCRQEMFIFSLSEVFSALFSEKSLGATTIGDFVESQPSSYINVLFSCGGDVTMAGNAMGVRLMLATIWRYRITTLDVWEAQQNGLNEAVIAFSLFLKNGFDPSTKLDIYKTPGPTTTDLTYWDPHFTKVAWQLARALHGFLPKGHSDPRAYLREKLDRERSESNIISIAREDREGRSEEKQHVPGA